MRPRFHWLRWLIGCFAIACFAQAWGQASDRAPAPHEVTGHGDGRIHVIGSLSAQSIKNGDSLTIAAVVKAAAGVEKVEAQIIPMPTVRVGYPAYVQSLVQPLRKSFQGQDVPLATLTLAPAPDNLGGVYADGTLGMWQAVWRGEGLAEGYYQVALTVTDRTGHTYVDRSLQFSDPIAGNNLVGSANYADGGMRMLSNSSREVDLSCAVIDAEAGYALFGTFTTPGRVVKVALGDGDTTPTRIGSIELNRGEDKLDCAVLDGRGYAYFGTYTKPGRVVKVAMGNGDELPQRIAAITLANEEEELACAVIDPEAGYAYFGAARSLIKVALGEGDNPPRRVAAVSLVPGGVWPCTAVIDTRAGYAYFGTMSRDYRATSPASFFKVKLGEGDAPPTRVGSVSMEPGQLFIRTAMIDTVAGYAYFDAGGFVKVALGEGDTPPRLIGKLALLPRENAVCVAIDPAAGCAYLCGGTTTSMLIKVALGNGDTTPTLIGRRALGNELREVWNRSETVATASHAYVNYGHVVKLPLDLGEDLATRRSDLYLPHVDSVCSKILLDEEAGYGYFSATNPTRVLKVRLGDHTHPAQCVAALAQNSGEAYFQMLAIDPDAGYLYMLTGKNPARVTKVALNDGDTTPTRVAKFTLNPEETSIRVALIDSAAGFGYFGTEEPLIRVVKVALGDGDTTPTRVASLDFNSETDRRITEAAVLDPAAGYAYFAVEGTFTMYGPNSGRIHKIALGSGNLPPTHIATRWLGEDNDYFHFAILDAKRNRAYFGSSGYSKLGLGIPSGKLLTVALGDGDSTPTYLGWLSIQPRSLCGGIDAATNSVYIGTISYSSSNPDVYYPPMVEKVALGNGAELPSRVGSLLLNGYLENLDPVAVDGTRHQAYFGLQFSPGEFMRVGLTQQGCAKMTRFTLPEAGRIQQIAFYSHVAEGNVRLALYQHVRPGRRALLWESRSTSNTVSNGYLQIPVNAGNPAQLHLAAGTYSLAWQIDTLANVPSYSPGAMGDGALVPMNYGPFPPSLELNPRSATAWKDTTERWTGYITYDSINGVEHKVWLGYDSEAMRSAERSTGD